jgi:hypothetical protein
MSRSAARFKQADVVRVLKAAEIAGFSVARVEISPDGRINVFSQGQPADDVDADLRKFRERAGWSKST